jgi:rhamnosyltransferase
MRATVVIRAKNEADSIGRTLDIVRGQTVEPELIVVDSGSSDGTPEISRERGARVIEIPAEEFTFGGALNLGADAATAPIVVALSAHAFPRDEDWLARVLAPFDDARTACATGAEVGPDGQPIERHLIQDIEFARRFPYWGYSNAAGAFRRELQQEYPFRADMPGTEDKEWSWHWLQRGRTCVLGPGLTVDHDHSNDPLRETWVRATREWIGYGMYLPVERYPVREALRDWRNEARRYRHPLNILREGVAVAGHIDQFAP